MATGLEKVSFHSNPKENAEECSNYWTIAVISHDSKIILKMLQARPQKYMNWELLDVQGRFRKGWGTRDQTVNIHWVIEKTREFQKNIYFCFHAGAHKAMGPALPPCRNQLENPVLVPGAEEPIKTWQGTQRRPGATPCAGLFSLCHYSVGA